MAAIEVGSKCIKTAGRKAGQEMTVSKVIDANFVEIRDPKGKTKRCNVSHLEPI